VLALDIQGNVYSWGRNFHGQLGHGEFKKELGPTSKVVQDTTSTKADKKKDAVASSSKIEYSTKPL